MKMTKQQRDAVILSVAIVVLIVIGMYTLRTPGAIPPPAEPAKSGEPAPAPAAAPKNAAFVDWVRDTRLDGIVSEVQGGRNPFDDLSALHVREPVIIPPDVDTAAAKPKPPAAPAKVSQVVHLAWITWKQLAAHYAEENIFVEVGPGARPGDAKLSGLELDVAQALARLAEFDAEPAKPNFVLNGIIATATTRYVVLTVNGKYYSLYEGDTIPTLGWTVTRITSSGVMLQKAKQRVMLRLSGGKA